MSVRKLKRRHDRMFPHRWISFGLWASVYLKD